MPDMPLDQLRGPVARAAPAPSATRAWGIAAATRPASPPPTALDTADRAVDEDEADDGFAPTQPGVLDALSESGVPEAAGHVPAFLKAPVPPGPGFLSANALGFPAQRLAHDQVQTPATAIPPPVQMRGMEASAAELNTPLPRTSERGGLLPASGLEASRPGGYELPAPQWDTGDSEWPALFEEVPKPPPAPASEPTLARTRGVGVQTHTRLGDASEPDLAHFIAELGQEPEANGAASLDTAPALDAVNAVPQEAVLAKSNEGLEHDAETNWTLVQEGSPVSAEPFSPVQAAVAVSQPLPIALPSDGDISERDAQEALDLDDDLSFVRSARRRAFWSGKGVRVGLSLLATALLLGLAGQLVLHERARVAATWPQSRSVLESACTYLQCTVGLYRDIGAVLVDGSSFNRAQGDQYQFSLTLRNRATLPVEAPAIELTLTDAQDQTVLRRVLLPAELAIPNPLGPGQEWSTIAPMALGQGAARVAGYRVLAFYP